MTNVYNIVRTDVFEQEIVYQLVQNNQGGAAALRRLAGLVDAQIDEEQITFAVATQLHRKHGGYATDDITKCMICQRDRDTALPVEPPTRGRHKLFKS